MIHRRPAGAPARSGPLPSTWGRVWSVGGLLRRLGAPAEHRGSYLPAGVGDPVVLTVGLLDEPVEFDPVEPGLAFGHFAESLEAAALRSHGRGEELELDECAQAGEGGRRTSCGVFGRGARGGHPPAVTLPPRNLLADPQGQLLVLMNGKAE